MGLVRAVFTLRIELLRIGACIWWNTSSRINADVVKSGWIVKSLNWFVTVHSFSHILYPVPLVGQRLAALLHKRTSPPKFVWVYVYISVEPLAQAPHSAFVTHEHGSAVLNVLNTWIERKALTGVPLQRWPVLFNSFHFEHFLESFVVTVLTRHEIKKMLQLHWNGFVQNTCNY